MREKKMDDFETEVQQSNKDELAKGKLKAAFKRLRIRDFAPMLYLKECLYDSMGRNTETYVTDPIQVDRIAREAWNPIYAGNVTDKKEHFKAFLNNHGNDKGNSFIYQPEKPTDVTDIDP